MTSLLPNGAQPRHIILKQGFDPEPTMKRVAFARRLGELGCDIEEVTGFPYHPSRRTCGGYRIRAIARMVARGVDDERIIAIPNEAVEGGVATPSTAITRGSFVASGVMPSLKRDGTKV